MTHGIMKVNFFDITFIVVNENSYIFVHILATFTHIRILHNFKWYLPKSEQIVGNSSNISEFNSPTIFSNEGDAKKVGAKGDLGSEEKCTITKLLGMGQSTLEIPKHLGRDHRTIKKYVRQPDYSHVRSDKGRLKSVCTSTISRSK